MLTAGVPSTRRRQKPQKEVACGSLRVCAWLGSNGLDQTFRCQLPRNLITFCGQRRCEISLVFERFPSVNKNCASSQLVRMRRVGHSRHLAQRQHLICLRWRLEALTTLFALDFAEIEIFPRLEIFRWKLECQFNTTRAFCLLVCLVCLFVCFALAILHEASNNLLKRAPGRKGRQT